MKGWISSHQVTLTPWHATVWGIAFDQFSSTITNRYPTTVSFSCAKLLNILIQWEKRPVKWAQLLTYLRNILVQPTFHYTNSSNLNKGIHFFQLWVYNLPVSELLAMAGVTANRLRIKMMLKKIKTRQPGKIQFTFLYQIPIFIPHFCNIATCLFPH